MNWANHDLDMGYSCNPRKPYHCLLTFLICLASQLDAGVRAEWLGLPEPLDLTPISVFGFDFQHPYILFQSNNDPKLLPSTILTEYGRPVIGQDYEVIDMGYSPPTSIMLFFTRQIDDHHHVLVEEAYYGNQIDLGPIPEGQIPQRIFVKDGAQEAVLFTQDGEFYIVDRIAGTLGAWFLAPGLNKDLWAGSTSEDLLGYVQQASSTEVNFFAGPMNVEQVPQLIGAFDVGGVVTRFELIPNDDAILAALVVRTDLGEQRVVIISNQPDVDPNVIYTSSSELINDIEVKRNGVISLSERDSLAASSTQSDLYNWSMTTLTPNAVDYVTETVLEGQSKWPIFINRWGDLAYLFEEGQIRFYNTYDKLEYTLPFHQKPEPSYTYSSLASTGYVCYVGKSDHLSISTVYTQKLGGGPPILIDSYPYGSPMNPQLVLNDTKILYEKRNHEPGSVGGSIFLADIDGQSPPVLIGDGQHSDITTPYFISPDAKYCVFEHNGDTELSSVNLETLEVVNLHTATEGSKLLHYSFVNGGQSVITRDYIGSYYICPIDGSSESVNLNIENTLPKASDSGEWIVFQSGNDVYCMELTPPYTQTLLASNVIPHRLIIAEDTHAILHFGNSIGLTRLQSVPLDASTPPITIATASVNGFLIEYGFSYFDGRVIYREKENGVWRTLRCVPLDGSESPVEIANHTNTNIASRVSVYAYEAEEDRILFDVAGDYYRTALDGSEAPELVIDATHGVVTRTAYSQDYRSFIRYANDNLIYYTVDHEPSSVRLDVSPVDSVKLRDVMLANSDLSVMLGLAYRNDGLEELYVIYRNVAIEDWRTQTFASSGLPKTEWADDADPNHNGFTNLQDYFFGFDPLNRGIEEKTPQVTLQSVAPGISKFSLIFPISPTAENIEVNLLMSHDLINWSPVDPSQPLEIVQHDGDSYLVVSTDQPDEQPVFLAIDLERDLSGQ